MVLFSNVANAGEQLGEVAQNPILSVVPMILIFIVFYFFLIRPQVKKQKELQIMVESIKKGDQVIASGIVGTVIKIEDNFFHVEIAKDIKIKVAKNVVTALSNTKPEAHEASVKENLQIEKKSRAKKNA